ncbi:MAG: hypothetical protein HQK58_10200, partial [Deltaproteobacteria bacterium]|nr:hypothetical protein [Deltaproteobacteria bacterium]
LLKLSAEAEAAGITAIVGIGATPGITNMLAAKVHRMLTRTTELHAAWNIEEKASAEDESLEYSAAIIHWMQQCSGTILEHRDGRLTSVKPLQEVILNYPGRGSRPVWTVGHPEPVSFSWSYPEIKQSACYMVMPALAADYFKKLSRKIDDGKLSIEEAGHQLVDSSKNVSWFDKILESVFHIFDRPRLPLFFVIGKGDIDGRKATIAASIKAFPPGMARATGIPLAIGLHQFAQGRVKVKGVTTPELALDADAFFLELAPYCTYPGPLPAEDILDMVQELE